MSSATKLELLDITAQWRRQFEFMQITLIFPSFFDEAEKKISNRFTTKFILYVKKRLQTKIGACIRPVTINALSDLTMGLDKLSIQRSCHLFSLEFETLLVTFTNSK